MNKYKKGFLNLYERYTSVAHCSETWNDVSTIGFKEYEDCPGEVCVNWKDCGYSTILDILMVIIILLFI